MKREIEKFPYGSGSGLSEIEAQRNLSNFCKEYGPLTVRLVFFVWMFSSSSFAVDPPTPTGGPAGNQCAPTPAPNSTNVLPATKELLGAAGVGLICAAAASNPVTALGVAACILAVAAKAFNKL